MDPYGTASASNELARQLGKVLGTSFQNLTSVSDYLATTRVSQPYVYTLYIQTFLTFDILFLVSDREAAIRCSLELFKAYISHPYDLLVDLDGLRDQILSIFSEERVYGSRWVFERLLSSQKFTNRETYSIIKLIYKSVDSRFVSPAMGMKLIIQFSEFLRKFDPSIDDIPELFQEFIEADSNPAPISDTDVSAVRDYLLPVMRTVDYSVFCPHHGPGTVAEGTLYKSIVKTGDSPIKDWHLYPYRYPSILEYALRRHNLGTPWDYIPSCAKVGNRSAKVIQVPKTWKTKRLITQEPAFNQYMQQGVRNLLRSALPAVRRNVDLHNNDFVHYLARLGSLTGGFATIDLSKASDSISLSLVKSLLKGDPILPFLVGTRTPDVNVDGVTYSMHKYAGMGNATTFILETYVFWGICASVILQGDCSVSRVLARERRFTVFGDDLVVPEWSYDQIVERLNNLGFTVNTEKSFVSGFFREACGKYYYHGSDVTPLRMHAAVKGPYSSVLNQQRDIALANHARGLYPTLARLMTRLSHSEVSVHVTVCANPYPYGYGIDDASLLVNRVHEHSWNPDYQCDANGRSTPILIERRFDRDDAVAYHHWLINHQGGVDCDPDETTITSWSPTACRHTDHKLRYVQRNIKYIT